MSKPNPLVNLIVLPTAAALVGAEVAEAGVVYFGPSGRPFADARMIEEPRQSHTDPEQPQWPNFAQRAEVYLSTSTALGLTTHYAIIRR